MEICEEKLVNVEAAEGSRPTTTELDEVATTKDTDVLLPKKRIDQISQKLNNKNLGTQSQIELLSFCREVKEPRSAFSSLFDVSRRLLRRQEPVYPSPGTSPAVSAESLLRRSPPCPVPRSETANRITERTRLLSAVDLPPHHKRSSVDTIPNLYVNLAGTSAAGRTTRSGSRTSVRSASTRKGGPFNRSQTPDAQRWTSVRRGTRNNSLMYRGFSTNSEPPNRIPGQMTDGTSTPKQGEDHGLSTMGKLSVVSLSPPTGLRHESERQESGGAANQLSGGAVPPHASNPLFQVSSDMLRITGYTNQFRTLLSNRDEGECSTPLRDTNTTTTTGYGAPDTPTSPKQNGGVQFHGIEEGGENANNSAQKQNKGSFDSDKVKRQDTRYGISISSESVVKQKMKIRKKLYLQRTKLCDYCVAFAIMGVALTVLEAELTAAGMPGFSKQDIAVQLLKLLILVSTVILMVFIVLYHSMEIKIAVIDSGADDWRVAITWKIIRRIALELIICGICPVPGTGTMMWPYLQRSDHRSIILSEVPLDVILSIPMFFRSYLLARFIVVHSRQFQDAATRSIAALNRVAVDFRFVVKTMMVENPLRVLIIFTLCYWICVAWMLTQCDRYGMPELEPGQERHTYLNSLWLIVVTFMSIGYGDVVPNTYCGRSVAIATGIVGAGVSSALIAVISRKLELTRAEKHVNNFMSDSKLTRQRKNAAAAVLQQTWFIHKYKTMNKGRDELKVRLHQRRFLHAINEFRRIKWDQRKLAEQGNDLIDVGKVQGELHESLWDMQKTQENLITQIDSLSQRILEMQHFVVTQNHEMHKMQEQMSQVYSAIATSPPARTSNNSSDTFLSKGSKQSSKTRSQDYEDSVDL